MDPLTLYKLMILYLLRAVRYPLTRAQLSDFMLEKEYCTYFTFQQAIDELLSSHLMKDTTVRNFTRYEITHEGEDALGYFAASLPEDIRKDMDTFLDENKIRLREEVGVVAEYQETPDGEYEVLMEIREQRGALMKLSLTVPTEEQAEVITSNWSKCDQEVYANVMKLLMHD